MKKNPPSFAVILFAAVVFAGTSSIAATFDEKIRSFADLSEAIVLTEGETFTLPELDSGASYVNLSAHRFMSIEGNQLTALDAGIGAFKAYKSSSSLIATVPVFIKPAGRQIDNVYILKVGSASSYQWSQQSNWVKAGSPDPDGYPDGQNDIAYIPFNKTGTSVVVDGSYSLAGLYCAFVVDGTANKQYLMGSKADGSASLTFYGITGQHPVPAVFMAANQSMSNIMEFYSRGTAEALRLAFRVGAGTLELDCGGPTDRIKSGTSSSHLVRWFNDNVYCKYDIPEGCTMKLVNGIRYGSFGDDQMGNEQHVNLGSADIITGQGTVEFDSCSAVGLWNDAFRSFRGTVKSQSLNFIRGRNSNRSGIVWSVNVNAPEVAAEINGYCTREFTAAYGVGAWCSGNSHGYGSPDSMTGNGLPGRSLTLNGGLLQLIGMNKTGSDTTFWKRADGAYEAHYQTTELVIGKGLSDIENLYNVTRNGAGVISHLTADSVTHSDPCGTLRVSDGHFRNNAAFGTLRSETTLKGLSSFCVGYKGATDKADNIFPIVPWAIGNSDGNSDYFWWLGFDESGNVIRVGNRSNVDRNAIKLNQNAYVYGNFDLSADKDVNSLVLRNDNRNRTMGAGRKLTIRSGALGLEINGTMLGTQTGGAANGTVIFPEKAFVFATASSETNPNQIWATIIAEKGFVSGYCGNLLLAGDQSGVKGELTVNNGTLQLGSLDGSVACQLGVDTVRVIGGNTVLRINKSGALEGKTVRFECPGGFSPRFKLQNNDPERCLKLYIDGKSVRSGVWGSSESGAPNVDDEHFTGPGTIIVQRDDEGIGFSMVFRP